jgi:chromate reductase
VLQNAIDWASRPAMKSPLAGKPVGIMGASPGALGAVRAQQQLKLVLLATLAAVMPHPGVAVGQVAEKFDSSGALVHDPSRQFLAAFLGDLAQWSRRFHGESEQQGRRAA